MNAHAVTIPFPLDAGENFFDRTPFIPKKMVKRDIAIWSNDAEDTDSPSESIATLNEVPFETTDVVRADVRRRLLELMKYSILDDEAVPEESSVSGLNAFLAKYSYVQTPLLSSDNRGLVVATWKLNETSMLSFRFIDRFNIQYAWALNGNGEKVERNWGEAPWEDFVKSFGYAERFLGASH